MLQKISKICSKNSDENIFWPVVWVFNFFSLEYANAVKDPPHLWPKTATSIDLCLKITSRRSGGNPRSYIFCQWNIQELKVGKKFMLRKAHSVSETTQRCKTLRTSGQERKDSVRSFLKMKGSRCSWRSTRKMAN